MFPKSLKNIQAWQILGHKLAFNATELLMQFSKKVRYLIYCVTLRSMEIFPRTSERQELNLEKSTYWNKQLYHFADNVSRWTSMGKYITYYDSAVWAYYKPFCILNSITVCWWPEISHYGICFFILVGTKWALCGVKTFYLVSMG